MTSPERSRLSPCTKVIWLPAGPTSVSRTHPLMFWPRSATCRSGVIRVTETGRTSLDPADGWRGRPAEGVRLFRPSPRPAATPWPFGCGLRSVPRSGRLRPVAPHPLSIPSRSTRSTRRFRADQEMPACLRTRPFDDAFRAGPGTSRRTPRPPTGSTPGPGAPSRRRPGPAAGWDSW